ncbi:MAG: hypothetical protein KIS61_08030 [Candidatus Eremiobacteraeota bacterium]|nr:hypothetical protein [Candidatus Eremiobacteraeota bacterium]
MPDLDKALQPLLAEIQKLHQGFIEVNKRFDEVDKRFDGVDKRFDGVDKRFDAMDDEILHLKHAVRTLGLEFERFRSDQLVQKEVLLELRGENLRERVEAVEDEQDRHDIRLTALERRRF